MARLLEAFAGHAARPSPDSNGTAFSYVNRNIVQRLITATHLPTFTRRFPSQQGLLATRLRPRPCVQQETYASKSPQACRKQSGIPCTMVYGLYVLSPVTGYSIHTFRKPNLVQWVGRTPALGHQVSPQSKQVTLMTYVYRRADRAGRIRCVHEIAPDPAFLATVAPRNHRPRNLIPASGIRTTRLYFGIR